MAPRGDREPRPEPKDLRPKAPDQLSPNRALQQSLGASGSQRLGNSGPVGNPTVTFPGEPADDEA